MDWLLHLLAFIAGLGAGWTLKVVISNRSDSSRRTSIVSQKGIQACGDVVAGDKSHTSKK
jgi:hypothetical protein